jgi:hypothetical protein
VEIRDKGTLIMVKYARALMFCELSYFKSSGLPVY